MQDTIKQAIAQHVQRLIMETNWNTIIKPPEDMLNTSVRESKLRTMLHIPTNEGPRYFEIIVKELK